jgi:hypothetical protein
VARPIRRRQPDQVYPASPQSIDGCRGRVLGHHNHSINRREPGRTWEGDPSPSNRADWMRRHDADAGNQCIWFRGSPCATWSPVDVGPLWCSVTVLGLISARGDALELRHGAASPHVAAVSSLALQAAVTARIRKRIKGPGAFLFFLASSSLVEIDWWGAPARLMGPTKRTGPTNWENQNSPESRRVEGA